VGRLDNRDRLLATCAPLYSPHQLEHPIPPVTGRMTPRSPYRQIS
jgi:hypothetical protein